MDTMPRGLKILNGLTLALFSVALYMVLIYAPREAVMGDVQRIFYFHVSAGWVSALAFLVTAITGGVYLACKKLVWDGVALASAEIGVIFTMINIVSGSVWARPIWNTWWTWDPRLVTAVIMELIYFAYLMLRRGIEDPCRQARFGAIYGIVGFLSVPVTFLSIRFLRTIHPVVVGMGDSTASGVFVMSPKMLQTLMLSLAAFSILYFDLLWHRLRLLGLENHVKKLRHDVYSK